MAGDYAIPHTSAAASELQRRRRGGALVFYAIFNVPDIAMVLVSVRARALVRPHLSTSELWGQRRADL